MKKLLKSMKMKKMLRAVLAVSTCFALVINVCMFASAEESTEPTLTLDTTNYFVRSAAVRLADTVHDSGVRFKTVITKDVFEAQFLEENGDMKSSVKTYTVLIPSGNLSGDLTAETTGAKVIDTTGIWKEVEYGGTGYYESTVYVYNIPKANYGSDITVRSYVQYGEEAPIYTAAKSASMAYVADAAVDSSSSSLTDEQKRTARTNIGAGTSSFSGSYNDLSNKPTLATVATSGSYNDLSNKPTIHDVDATLSVEGDAADAKAVGDAVAQLTEQKADKSELEKLNTPKNYIILIDQVSGVKYRIAVRDGSIVSYVHIEGITVTSAPAKITYMAGEYFDSTGLVISTVSSDGSTVEVSEFVVDEIYANTYLTEDVTEIGISYTDESGEVYTTNVPITVTPFDPAVALVDFGYIANDNVTYTITGWKETLNGESSTEMIIPNNGLIIV